MQDLIRFENNHVSFDFENKPDQKIKIVGTYDEPYFCGKDLCAILEYKSARKALQDHVKLKHKKDLQTLIRGIPNQKMSHNDGRAVYISKDGLIELLTKSRTLASYHASKVISDKLGLNLQFVYNVSKHQETLNTIKAAFKDLSCISEYTVDTYRIDLYFPDLNLAVECDEHGHVNRDQHYEQEREEYIKKVLGCVFIRYNPDSSRFDIGDVIYEIRSYEMRVMIEQIQQM
jgi:prophage antirepressor-like protein